MQTIDSIESKLYSQDLSVKKEALLKASHFISSNPSDKNSINSLALKLADVFSNINSTNELRLTLLQELRKVSKVVEKAMLNPKQFADRIVLSLRNNNFITRILALRVLQAVPSFLTESLDI